MFSILVSLLIEKLYFGNTVYNSSNVLRTIAFFTWTSKIDSRLDDVLPEMMSKLDKLTTDIDATIS